MKISKFVLALFLMMASISDATEFFGEWKQGAVIRGKTDITNNIYFDNRLLKLTNEGYFVLGLGRDAAPTADVKEVSADGKETYYRFDVVQRQYAIQDIKGVPQRTVEPDPKQVERARKEAELSANARKANLSLTDFSKPFIWPLTGRISGVYGSQRIYNGVPNSPHYGIDIARPTGTLVLAPAGGVVTLVHPDMFFSGGTLIIDHGHGLSSTFIHLSEILVKEGEAIQQSQPIARVGATGRATGPHLDWRMNWFEARVDPQLLVGPMPHSK